MLLKYARMRSVLVSIFLVVVLSSCALIGPAYEKPQMQLVTIQRLSSSGFDQRFRVGLNIINPNHSALRVSGMSYALTINGEKVLTGVSGKIPKIAAYSEARIDVEASTNMFSGLKLLASLLKTPQKAIHYELVAKLRMAWWPIPIKVVESGDMNLSE